MVAINAANAAAAAAKAKTRALDAFRTHDATAAGRARTLAEVGLSGDDHAVRELIAAGVIRGVDNRGRLTVLGDSIDRVAGYYLDETAYIAHRDCVRKPSMSAALVLIGILCVIGVAVAVIFKVR